MKGWIFFSMKKISGLGSEFVGCLIFAGRCIRFQSLVNKTRCTSDDLRVLNEIVYYVNRLTNQRERGFLIATLHQ